MIIVILENNITILTDIERLLANKGLRVVATYAQEYFFKALEYYDIGTVILNKKAVKNNPQEFFPKKLQKYNLLYYKICGDKNNKTTHIYQKNIRAKNNHNDNIEIGVIISLMQYYFFRRGINAIYYPLSIKKNIKNISQYTDIPIEFIKTLPKTQNQILKILIVSKNGVYIDHLKRLVWKEKIIENANRIYTHISFLRKNLSSSFSNKYEIRKKNKKYYLIVNNL